MKSALFRSFSFLFLQLSLITLQSANPSGWMRYEKSFLEAKSSIEILAPGFFSIHLSKALEKKASEGIHVRILLDSTYLDDPTNHIGILSENLSLRIREESRLIPLTLVILDRKKLLIGGDFLSDSDTTSFPPMELSDPPTVSSYLKKLQNLWAGADPAYTADILRELSFQTETQTILTRDQDMDSPGAKEGFVASIHSKVYHRASSPSARRIKSKNRIYFQTEVEARQSNRVRAKNF